MPEPHTPYFVILVTIIDVALMIFEIQQNNGIENFTFNPWLGPSVQVLVEIGAKSVAELKLGEWWRFITPIFLHVGIIHLLLNMVMQLRLGYGLEKQFGSLRIAPIYIMSGIYGNLVSAIFLPTRIQV